MRALTTVWPTNSLTNDLFSEVDRWFDLWSPESTSRFGTTNSLVPSCEVTEKDQEYQLSVDLPGMKKDEIKIEVNDRVLTVSGERRREETNSKIHQYSKSYGYFTRSFSLPSVVATGEIQATYENGVLQIKLPKAAEAKPRQIAIP